ncbi:hypothetical protein [Dapis sp. BLCC M172]|uniref:hypothetical protein n=1 Tax=Dapis sp. BLCC M172 TaxID=2975281 RepID=UPI003CED895D
MNRTSIIAKQSDIAAEWMLYRYFHATKLIGIIVLEKERSTKIHSKVSATLEIYICFERVNKLKDLWLE